MSKRITVQLNEQSVQDALDKIETYKDSLIWKCTVIVSELQKIGIQTMVENKGEYGSYIIFEKTAIEQTSNGARCAISMSDAEKIVRSWKTKKGGVKTAEVSPILMTEFGSGRNALEDANVPGVGPGTFPGQKHALDPDGWWWIDADDKNNVWQHSTGHTPTLPMHRAIYEMRDQIVEVARRVFADG